MEKLNQPQEPELDYDFEDFEDAPFYNLLCRMPRELAERHLFHIVANNLGDSGATEYLEEILSERREVTTTTEISDDHAKELFENQGEKFLREIETTVFTGTDNFLGSGRTARVKQFDAPDEEGVLPMAIKYLVTPTAKTLSTAAEHDMIREVERIKQIEEIERDYNFQHLSVPHPYFHHKTTQIQCYGMQYIDGPDLERGVEMMDTSEATIETIRKWSELDVDAIQQEVDLFLRRMHTYCLHGDMKPKNLMIDSTGKIYIIDFGQSVLAMNIDEDASDQFENLKEMEVSSTKEIIRDFIRKAKQYLAEAAA